MLNGLFDMDKPFWRWMGKLPDIIGLSLCWYICCIPLITFIPASCALYDAVSRNLMTDEKGTFARFFRTFVRELKKGIPLSILWLLIFAIAGFGISIMNQSAEASPMFSYLSPIYLVLTLMMVAYLGWLIPLQSRFHNSIWGLHVNALRFSLGRFWGSLWILFSTVAVIVICLLHTMTLPLICIAPCLITIFHSIPVERGFRIVFPQYYDDETN